MLDLEVFRFFILHVEDICNVVCDGSASERNDAEVAKQLATVDSHCGGFAAHVHKNASR